MGGFLTLWATYQGDTNRNRNGLFQSQLLFNIVGVAMVNKTGMREFEFAFLGLFGKNVAFESVLSF